MRMGPVCPALLFYHRAGKKERSFLLYETIHLWRRHPIPTQGRQMGIQSEGRHEAGWKDGVQVLLQPGQDR